MNRDIALPCSRLAALLLFAVGSAHAGEPLDMRVGADVRVVSADAEHSIVGGGLDRTRFDGDHDGLRFGSAWLRAQYRLSDALSVRTDLLSYGDGHGAALDATQLYLQFRPFPSGPVRWGIKAGAFYPELSMENRGPAWTPVYTLTPSAINAWYGEELRAIGVETEARWLGANQGYNGDVGLIAGVYGWNDPIGTLIAFRGWALHDRQTGLKGYLSGPPGTGGVRIKEFTEIDGRPGYYAGVDWRHGDRLDFRVFRYDNRADPAAHTSTYAWLTRFTAAGMRWEADAHWTLIGQVLRGDTAWGPPATWEQVWDMDAWFVMASSEWNQWRFSLRRDGFSTQQVKGMGVLGNYDDRGHAWTASAIWSWREHWQLLGEWLQIDSRFPYRATYGETASQKNRQFQLAMRYQWHY